MMIDVMYGVGLIAAVIVGYAAWKYQWKMGEML
jgi:hypothetical protein